MWRGWERRVWTHLLRVVVLLSIALGVSPVTHAVGAERLRGQLRVQPGATCLSADELAVQVEQWLENAPVAADVTIVVDGSATDPRGVRLHIARDGRTVAERVFEPGPTRCDHLHAAVALAIALALKASPIEAGEQPLADEPVVPAPEPAVTRRWSAAGSALATYRLLPELAPGLELSVRYRLNEHFALRMGALGVAAFDVQLAAQAASFDATLAAARADGCGRRQLTDALYGGVCLGLLGGLLHAAGSDVASPRSSTVPVLALAGAAELELSLSLRWSVALGLSMTILLHQVEVGLEDASGAQGSSQGLSNPGFSLGLGPVYTF
jgi:hypothetical protein